MAESCREPLQTPQINARDVVNLQPIKQASKMLNNKCEAAHLLSVPLLILFSSLTNLWCLTCALAASAELRSVAAKAHAKHTQSPQSVECNLVSHHLLILIPDSFFLFSFINKPECLACALVTSVLLHVDTKAHDQTHKELPQPDRTSCASQTVA